MRLNLYNSVSNQKEKEYHKGIPGTPGRKHNQLQMTTRVLKVPGSDDRDRSRLQPLTTRKQVTNSAPRIKTRRPPAPPREPPPGRARLGCRGGGWRCPQRSPLLLREALQRACGPGAPRQRPDLGHPGSLAKGTATTPPRPPARSQGHAGAGVPSLLPASRSHAATCAPT